MPCLFWGHRANFLWGAIFKAATYGCGCLLAGVTKGDSIIRRSGVLGGSSRQMVLEAILSFANRLTEGK